MDFKQALAHYQERVNATIERYLPDPQQAPEALHSAMHYSATGGGKRVRPLLCYATAEALGQSAEQVDGAAAALELIHAYSLVHDDLPAMDDDDLRRGQATCHIAFDEATAILAGDALQTLAFDILASDQALTDDPARRLRAVKVLASASGVDGMVGGQAIDIAAEGQQLTLDQLKRMHALKTGALIRASVQISAALAGEAENGDTYQRLSRYAECIGLAFQIRDDILDVISDTQTLGKTQGADEAHNKPTYTSLLGLEGAKQHAIDTHAEAIACLEPFGERAQLLKNIADYIVERAH
ncbi:geranyltranstransferase [gamma proteobacterium HTCC5015]|nr:geranyltranstransferase [gamma proteobacterium HTCC5015]